MRPLDLLLVGLINLIWAANTIAVKEGVDAVEPLTAAALRFGLVALACLPWLRWVRGRMRDVLTAAVFQGVLHFGLLNLAYGAADNIAALAIVNQVYVPFSLIFAVIFLDERVRLVRSVATGAAMMGVALIGFDPAVLRELEGVLLVALSSLCYAAATVPLRRLQGVHPLTIQGWLAITAAPALAVPALLFEPGAVVALPSQPFAALAPVLYSAFAASLIGHVGIAWLLQRYPVSAVTPLLVPAPVLGAALAVVVYDNPVTWRLVAGGLIATAAVAVITLRTGAPPAPRTAT